MPQYLLLFKKKLQLIYATIFAIIYKKLQLIYATIFAII